MIECTLFSSDCAIYQLECACSEAEQESHQKSHRPLVTFKCNILDLQARMEQSHRVTGSPAKFFFPNRESYFFILGPNSIPKKIRLPTGEKDFRW